MKWLSNLWHALTHATTGEFLTTLTANAKADLAAAQAKALAAYKADIAMVEEIGHKELTALEQTVAHAQERIRALLDSEVDLAERNVDAAKLALHLGNAVQ